MSSTLLSCGLLVINERGDLLVGHSTGSAHWDLPKGLIDPGETPYANNPRYNMDGTPKRNTSPAYWITDLRGEYRIDRQWSAFLGIDNVFDFNQADKESMLWIDGSGALDVTQIWGPNPGRFVYVGVKFAL